MKAARLYEYDPAMNVELKIEEVKPPTVNSPDEVIVKVGAAGLWLASPADRGEGTTGEGRVASIWGTFGGGGETADEEFTLEAGWLRLDEGLLEHTETHSIQLEATGGVRMEVDRGDLVVTTGESGRVRLTMRTRVIARSPEEAEEVREPAGR